MKEILSLCDGLPQRELCEGEILLAEGQQTGAMYVLGEGCLEIRKGEVVVNQLDEPGSLVGEMSVLLSAPHTATVQARQASRVFVIADAALFLRQQPTLALSIARLLAGRLHLMTTYLADIRQQFGGMGGSLGLIDEVLQALSSHADEPGALPSDRDPDPWPE